MRRGEPELVLIAVVVQKPSRNRLHFNPGRALVISQS